MTVRRLVAACAIALAASSLTTLHAAAADPVRPVSKAAIPTDQPEPRAGTQVVNGERTTVKEHPSVIAGLRVGGGGPQGQSCTASVVGKRKILTAAHCMIDVGGDKSYVYGDDDLNTPEGATFRTKVASYKVHPKYTGSGSWKNGFDVAVITTEDDIPVPESQWAKVAGSGDSGLTEPGKTGFALGYGRTAASGGTSGVLYKATMPINDPGNCQVFDVSVNGEYMVCVGYDDGRIGTCSGDSGGPYTVDGVVVGVVSWGASNCDRYSIMARLTNEMGDWAKKEIGGGDHPGDGKFTVGLTPSSGKVEPGKHVSTTLTSKAGKQGAEKLELSASGLPAGVTATFQPTSINSGDTAKLTFETTANTPKGTHKISVVAAGASAKRTVEYSLTVGDGDTTEGPRPTVAPGSATVQRGGMVEAEVTVTGGKGASRLSAKGLQFAPSFFPSSVEPGGTSSMSVFAPFKPGTYKVVITATDSAGKSGSAEFVLTVK
ncbi:trypsin-like serine protease [Streptoalloteichus hindustanus]|uniref:Trypsin n=1 Tax=Streptoalloteichus hindustanus TaxID=2017 RepID=A0A1M5MYC6_STRHI|nr:trypsin-like serine protease [Streptoalloteichus hindustanus]SHG82281.1 Trypsin [Streptoalloteichus hindustanus]